MMHLVRAALVLAVLGSASVAGAGEITVYTDRAAFMERLATSVTDDFSDPGYAVGDLPDTLNYYGDLVIATNHSDEHMSAVLGETRFIWSGAPWLSYPGHTVWLYKSPHSISRHTDPPIFCSNGCQSFALDFTDTSVGTENGVFGVGFDIVFNAIVKSSPDNLNIPAVKYATIFLGPGVAYDEPMPNVRAGIGFWGIVSTYRINAIHFGNANGQPTANGGAFEIDNLTIGSQFPIPTPEPAAGELAMVSLGVVATLRRRGIRPR